jgi:hypothetical protein
MRSLSPARSEAGRPLRISPLIQITNSRLPARHQGESQMSEDDSVFFVSDQLVGNDQPIQGAIIHCGQLALVRLEQNQTWPDWCAVIRALAKGRETCRQASGGRDKGRRFNKAMARWLRCYGFDRIDKSDRSRLRRCADHLEDLDTWRSERPLSEQLELNHPRIVFERWQRTVEKDENTPTPSVKQKPTNPSGFTDAEWTDALRTDLGFERFLQVMPNEWRPELELRAGGLSRAKVRHPNTKLKNFRVIGGTEASPASH